MSAKKIILAAVRYVCFALFLLAAAAILCMTWISPEREMAKISQLFKEGLMIGIEEEESFNNRLLISVEETEVVMPENNDVQNTSL